MKTRYSKLLDDINRLTSEVEELEENLYKNIPEQNFSPELSGLISKIKDLAVAASIYRSWSSVEKGFIPLDSDKTGRKLSNASEETDDLSIFGYYSGCKSYPWTVTPIQLQQWPAH